MLTRAQINRLRKQPAKNGPNRVEFAIQLAGTTQLRIEAETKIPQSYVSRIKRGRYSGLPVETARVLADYFGCHIEDLFPAGASAVSL